MGVQIAGRLFSNWPWRSAGIYTLANFISATIPFALIPILTRYLSPSDYGIAATFQVLAGFIAPFIGLSINGAIARMYFDAAIDLPRYIGNCLILLAGSTVLLALILCLNFVPISAWTLLPREILWLVMLVAVGQYVSLIVLTLWQVESKAVLYGMFKIATALCGGILSVWMIAVKGMDGMARFGHNQLRWD